VNNEILKMHDKNCVVRIEDITLSKNSSLVGKPVRAINFPDFTQLLILALIRPNNPVAIYNPKRSMILEAGDTIVLQADVESLQRFRKYHA